MSRVDYVARNAKFAAISQIALVLANFLVRKVFVVTLGENYLGLSGLFTDILSMLSLAELGFGTSVVYSLYKPLAEGDAEKIKSLMRVFRLAYRCVGIFVLVAGTALTPFLEIFVSEMPAEIPLTEIRWIYVLNVVNSGASYFFIYRASLLFADQKKYVETIITTVAKLAAAALQIGILLLTKNYFLYLGIMIVATFGQNFMVSLQTDRMYPFLKDKTVKKLDSEDKHVLKRNVGANVFHKIGYVAVFSTDSILMAKFVSVAIVGVYSNYMLVRKALQNVIELFFVSISASMGNVNACETQEKKYEAYSHIYFFAAWLFGFVCICLMILYNPFIELWLGKDYLLSDVTVFVIVLNFYMYCMRIPVNNTKEAMGLFWNDRYKPIAEVLINLGASILLGRTMGILGVLLGTLISTATVPFWVEPYVLYRHGLKKKVRQYYLYYFGYLAVTVLAGGVTGLLCSLAPAGIGGFILKMIFCAVVPNAVYVLVYFRTGEFAYFCGIALRMLRKIVKRGESV